MQTDFFDRESGIPVYRQLADYIKKQISNGVYQPGDVLPSEADYIHDFNVSRTTVRLAFGLITNAGMVRRAQGKGTIVVPQVHTQLPYLSSFTEESLHYKRKPSVTLLGQYVEQIELDAAIALSLPPDAEVLKVERLRFVDDEPIGLSLSSMNTICFPELKNQDFTVLSLYSLFESEMGLSIRSAKENIRADLAKENEARNLRIQVGAPVLRMMRTTFIQNEQNETIPIEYVEIVFNGSIYSVDVELFRQSAK